MTPAETGILIGAILVAIGAFVARVVPVLRGKDPASGSALLPRAPTGERVAGLEAKLEAIHGEVRGCRYDVRDLGRALREHELSDERRFARLEAEIAAMGRGGD